MKKKFLVLIILILAVELCACGTKEETLSSKEEVNQSNDELEDAQNDIEDDNSEEAELGEYNYENNLFMLNIPEELDGLFEIKYTGDSKTFSYTMRLSDIGSLATGKGELMYFVFIPDEDKDTIETYPLYDYYGDFFLQNYGVYHLIFSYPTDVQYDNETKDIYEKCYRSLPELLKTIQFKDGCAPLESK